MPYMIHTMTDETYAVNCTLTEQGEERREIILLCAAITFSLRALPFFRHGAVCDRSHRLLCVLFSGNTKSKPYDPGNAVYETAVKWYNDVT